MLRKLLTHGGLLLLAGALLFATPSFGWAQRGGSHAGGAHFGGTHIGGAHFGGAHVGGYRGGFYHYGYRPSYHNYGYRPSYRHHGGYGYYPYYGSLYGSYPYYDTYPYTGSGLTYNSGYYGLYGDETPSYPDVSPYMTPPATGYQAYYPPTTGGGQPDSLAHITVELPPNAQLWFNGEATTTTGSVRQFTSPVLTPGKKYSYQLQARWNSSGKAMTQTQQFQVSAGAHALVVFPTTAKTAVQTSRATHP
jgi:uncharacterized protein (TIGR03000 family)